MEAKHNCLTSEGIGVLSPVGRTWEGTCSQSQRSIHLFLALRWGELVVNLHEVTCTAIICGVV